MVASCKHLELKNWVPGGQWLYSLQMHGQLKVKFYKESSLMRAIFMVSYCLVWRKENSVQYTAMHFQFSNNIEHWNPIEKHTHKNKIYHDIPASEYKMHSRVQRLISEQAADCNIPWGVC